MRWLESLQCNRIGNLSLFSSVAGTRRRHTEQGQGIRLWEQWKVVFRRKFICDDSVVGRGIVMVQDPIAGAPLLRVMSAHSVAEALQDCFVEFLTYHLSSMDVLMMNQPVSVEERNQHGLDIGLHLPGFLQSRRWCRVPLGGHLLCFWVIPANPAFITSDYWGREVGIILDSITEVSANWHAIILLLHCQETGQKFHCHTSHLICRSSVRIFWHVLNAILTSSATSLIDVGQCEWFLAHLPWSPRYGRWKVCLGGDHLQKTGVHFWNRNTTQMSLINLDRTLRKLLAAFHTFQH